MLLADSLDEFLNHLQIAALIIFIIAPAIVIPISVFIGYRYTHTPKYLERERERLEYLKTQEENQIKGYSNHPRTRQEAIGTRGENSVHNLLVNYIGNKGWYLVENVIIPLAGYGGTTQIDHILINTSFIYVIETKNMHGDISGDPSSKTWIHKYGSRKFRMQNPFEQNKTHANALRALLKRNNIQYDYKNVVVIFGARLDSKIKNKVYTTSRLNEKIISDRAYKDNHSIEEAKEVYDLLCRYCQNPILTNEEHFESVRAKHPEYKPKRQTGRRRRRRKFKFPF